MLKTDFSERSDIQEGARRDTPSRLWRMAAVAALAIALLALFARIMTYPLQHDEQFYVSAGVLFDRYPLYSGIGFSHLPNLALLYAGAFALAGETHYLLVARLLLFAGWITAIAALLLIARTYVRDALVGVLMIAFLVLNPMFLDATGMAATNNVMPIPFALLGLYLFLRAVDRPDPSPWFAFASGVLLALSAGFKASYVPLLFPFAVAALIVPRSQPLSRRLTRVALPMLVGGLVGGLPTIIYAIGNPESFFAHVFSFQRGPQLGYWAAHADPRDPKVIGIADKALLAHRLWLSGVAMLMLVTLFALAAIALVRRQSAALRWPLVLAAAVAAIGVALSFVPTPSFPQYFTPPLPFAVVLIGLLFAALDEQGRQAARPLVAGVLALAVITGGPLLLPPLARLANPGEWTGVRVARDGAALAEQVRKNGGDGPVATLSPIHALEGHLPIYPEFALGPFVYRAAPWVPEDQRRYFTHFVTPEQVPALLDERPPAAILTGMEGDIDSAFDAFARQQGYPMSRVTLKQTEDAENVRLYLAR